MSNKFETDVNTPYGVVTVQHDGTLSEDEMIALAKQQRFQTEIQTPSGPVMIEHTSEASQKDLLFLAQQKEKDASIEVPAEYAEEAGGFRSDMLQVFSKAGEGPISALGDFVVNPVGDLLGFDEDIISKEDMKNARMSFVQAFAPLMGVRPEEVLTDEGQYKDYSSAAGPVGELGTLIAGGAGAFKAAGKIFPKLSDFKKSLASGFTAEQLYFQQDDGNISRYIEDEVDIENLFLKDTIEYLSTDEDDSALTARFKTGLEGMIIGGTAEKFISGVLGISKKFRPDKNKPISEQAEDLLSFIDDYGNEIQIAPANVHSDVVFSPNPNSVAHVEQQASNPLRRFANQIFLSRGYWTEEAFNMFRGKEYAHRQTVREAENIANRLNKALDELPVDQLDEASLTRALTEDLEFSPVASFDAKVEWVAADFGIPEDVAQDIVRAREMIDNLSGRIYNSSVPSDEVRNTIRENIGQYMTRSYRIYEDSGYIPSQDVVHNATKYIQNAIMQTDETIEEGKAFEQAYLQVQEILDLTDDDGVKDFFAKNVKVNNSILQQKDITLPKEIRQLLGEIENPTENIVLTLNKMSQLAENAEFGVKLLDSGMGRYIFDEKRAFGGRGGNILYNTKIEGTETALDGKYTTPEIATAIAGRQSRFGYENNPFIRTLASAKATSQAMKTVASWTTHVRNVLGGLQFGAANGISPIGNAKAWDVLMNAALKRGDRGLDSLYEEYLGLGVINTNVRVNEFRTLFEDAAKIRAGDKKVKLDVAYGATGRLVKGADEVAKGVGSKVYGGLEEAYRATDDFFKIHAFEKELDFLKRAMPDAPIDDLKKQAAEIVQDTFPNYDKVPNGIKATRFLPIGSFVSFPAEIMRTSANIIMQGSREIASDNTIIRQRGMQRLAGYLATNSVWAGSAKMGALALGLSPEEHEAIQTMSHTPWSKSPKIPVRWGDDIVTIDTQFIDSYSTIKEPFMVAADRIMNGRLKGEALERYLVSAGIDAITKTLAPYTDEAIVTETFSDMAFAMIAGNGRTPTGEQLFPTDQKLVDRFTTASTYMFDAFKPGVIKSFENVAMADNGEIRPGVLTPKKDISTELVKNFLGLPTRVLRPEEVVYFAGGNYKNASKQVTSPSIAEDVEGEDYVKNMKTRYESLYEAQQDLYVSLDAALTKLGPGKAQELLAKQVGAKAAFTILGNRFYLPEVPKLEEFLRLKNVTAEEAIEYHSELINARDRAMYTRLIPVEENTQREINIRDRFARGGEVKDVPNAPVEPDERINKVTGLPYSETAGPAFMDEEDPMRRLQLSEGSMVARALGISDDDISWAKGVGKKYGKAEELDGKGDAARHIALGWLAKQSDYPTAAKFAANAREIVELDFKGRKMDWANNEKGFNLEAKSRAEAEKAINNMIDSGEAMFMTPSESRQMRGYARGGKIDKKKMACNKPRRTPNHPKKSHVVKACEDGKEKIIRFGEQGAKTAGKPKAGESKRMKAKRKSFKARHRRNIKKGKMSAAYWADKVKW